MASSSSKAMRTLPGCHQPARRLPLLVLAAAAALGVRAAPSQHHHHHLASVAYASSSSSSSSSRRPSGGTGGTGGGSGSGKGRSRNPAAATGRPTPASYTYYVLHKPFQVMSQFSGGGKEDGDKRTLADVCGARVPRDVYPVGRLDFDSEGLLVLTNDPAVNYCLLDPVRGHRREYWVQVEGELGDEALRQLAAGEIELNLGKGKTHRTLPCEAVRLEPLLPSSSAAEHDEEPAAAADPLPAGIGPRDPPIRYRASIPTSWLRLRLTEGKNRQVRRMTAAVGFPTLRLVRWAIEDLTLEGLKPGDVVELSRQQLYRSLKID